MGWLTDPLALPFMQRALLATLLLAVAAGLLGTWIVLRRLAFFAHAVGTATFPGLVVAGPWGLAPPIAALGAGLGFAGLLSRMTRGGRTSADAATVTLNAEELDQDRIVLVPTVVTQHIRRPIEIIDDHIYVADAVNLRLLRLAKTFAASETIALK